MQAKVVQSVAILLALVNVVYSAQTATAACDPDTDTIKFTLDYGTDPIVGLYVYDAPNKALCPAPVASESGTTFQLSVTIDPNNLPCGVTLDAGTTYKYTVVTQSLAGAFTSKDKSYAAKCDIDAANENTVSTVDKTLDTKTITETPVDNSENVFSMDVFAPNGDPLPPKLILGTEMMIQVYLDSGPSAEFIVQSCKAYRSGEEATSVDLFKSKCIAKNAFTIFTGGAALDKYEFTKNTVPNAGKNYATKSATFEMFQFMNQDADDSIVFSCTLEACDTTGCGTNPTNTACTSARKRRSADNDTNKPRTVTATVRLIDPRRAAGHGAGADCNPLGNTGYLIGLIVLAALLIFTVAVTIFMFTKIHRPRNTDFPKA